MTRPPRPIVSTTAACACGAVAVNLDGPIFSMLLCACADCQKATGTGHAAIAIVGSDTVHIAGITKSYARPADSGAILTRHFCPECGTPIYGVSSRASQLVMLPAGLFGGDWFSPSQLIFARSHQDWDIVGESLPRHQTYRTNRLA